MLLTMALAWKLHQICYCDNMKENIEEPKANVVSKMFGPARSKPPQALAILVLFQEEKQITICVGGGSHTQLITSRTSPLPALWR